MTQSMPWHKQYPPKVPTEIQVDRYQSVVDLFDQSCRTFSQRPALSCLGRELSYADFDRLSRAFGAFLQKRLGLKRGDRIAIQLPNVLQQPIAMMGALRAGLVVVNTNPLYTPREMEHQFNDAGVKAVVILENFCANLQQVLPKTSVQNVITTQLGDLLPTPKKQIVNAVVKYVKKLVPPFSLPAAHRFDDALSQGQSLGLDIQNVGPDDIAFLQYTGGTTGVSKGAMLTHRNVVSNMEQIGAWIGGSLKDGEEVVITALPLYHIFSMTVNGLVMLKIGAKSVLIPNPKDLPAFIKELKKHPFSVMTGVNTLFNALLNQEAFKSVDFLKFKVCVGGGMAVQQVVAERWKKLTGCTLIEGYGLTETAPVLSCNPLGGGERVGHIGLPLPSTEMRILKDDGNWAEQGEVGEICGRGPQVMKGYWGRDDETQKVMTPDGFFKTGDIGFMTPDGFFKIVDRKKDMILVSGFNVYPNEVEDVLSKHPKVLEVAVIGVPDEKSGEAVKAVVVKRDPTLTPEEIREFAKKDLTSYKVPKAVEFRSELPKTNVGKILRRALRENSGG
jgi:long-chain acyl-CoA synthetase